MAALAQPKPRMMAATASLAKAFDEVVSPMLDQMHSSRQQNQKLQEGRDLLSRGLLSGEIAL